MSAFADLLNEARDLVRTKTRAEIRLHFDWDGTDGPQAWSCWADGFYGLGEHGTLQQAAPTSGAVFRGSAGEESLRRLVEAMR